MPLTWDTIYENGEMPDRVHSMDAVHQSDVISRLGLEYLQSAKPSGESARHDVNGWTASMTMPADLVDGRFDSLLDSMSRSVDADLLSFSEAQFQTFMAQRGHSLPTTLDHNPDLNDPRSSAN